MLILQLKYIYKKWAVWFSFHHLGLGWYDLRGFDKIVQKNPHLLEVNTSGWGVRNDIVLYSQIVLCYINHQEKNVEFIMSFLEEPFFPKLWSFLKLFPSVWFGVCLPINWHQDFHGFHHGSVPLNGAEIFSINALGVKKKDAGNWQHRGGTQNLYPWLSTWRLVFFLVDFDCLGVSVFFSPTWAMKNPVVGWFWVGKWHCLFKQKIVYENPSSFHLLQWLHQPASPTKTSVKKPERNQSVFVKGVNVFFSQHWTIHKWAKRWSKNTHSAISDHEKNV